MSERPRESISIVTIDPMFASDITILMEEKPGRILIGYAVSCVIGATIAVIFWMLGIYLF